MTTEGEVVEQVVEQAVEQPEVVEQQTDQQTEQEPEVKKEAEIPKGVQKRIDRAVRQKYEAEARAKMLEERLSYLEQQSRQAAPAPLQKAMDGEPTIDKFDNFDEYVAAKAKFIAKQELESTLSEREKRQAAERESAARQKAVESWSQRVEAATAELPDFEDVIASSDVPMSDVMQQAIMDSEVGPKLAYYLANNPDEARKIAGMTPFGQVRALGRIEVKLEQPAEKVVSKAPEPAKTVGNRASAKVDPDKMSTDEWLAWRREQIKRNA